MQLRIPSLKRTALTLIFGTFCGLLGCAATNWWMLRSTRSARFDRVQQVPENDVAVVLGTSPVIAGRWSNPFFEGRMNVAAELYRAGKIKHLLVSGDNSRKEYDEPSAMRDALIQRGVPADRVTLDYAGFRTLDTMARATAVFGLTRCTIVSDDFHLARCLFLARAHGLDAIGCAAPPVRRAWSRKTRLREVASRAAAWLDVCVLRTKPKFYGPKVKISLVQPAERS
jgi:SanA protein